MSAALTPADRLAHLLRLLQASPYAVDGLLTVYGRNNAASTGLRDDLEAVLADAGRYRALRNADPSNPRNGGIFIGCTPSNVILTEEDADRVIDEFMRDGLQGLARNLQTVKPKEG